MYKTLSIFFIFTIGVNFFPQILESSEKTSSVKKREISDNTDITIAIGICKFVIHRPCPDLEVAFYLYSQNHQEQPEDVHTGDDSSLSNLNSTAFDPSLPTKIIIHGFNSNMFINSLQEIKKQYFLKSSNWNIFFVDWAFLAAGPCYPAAVRNARHAGECTAQLVKELWELGNEDIHLIGYSLGAQVTNFVANALQPFKVSRITGLDPAGPGFLTVTPENRLDESDADFVDVIHTNAFVQGTFQESGHVDFFLNGGAIQPRCWTKSRSIWGVNGCSHERACYFFADSINSESGFWGWVCSSYIEYLQGKCPLTKSQFVKVGENIDKTSRGTYIWNTVEKTGNYEILRSIVKILLKY